MYAYHHFQTVKLTECRRVLLVHYEREKDEIEIRHYAIRATPTGVSKSVSRLVRAKLPLAKLANLNDVSDVLLSPGAVAVPPPPVLSIASSHFRLPLCHFLIFRESVLCVCVW